MGLNKDTNELIARARQVVDLSYQRRWLVFWILHPEINAIQVLDDDDGEGVYLNEVSFRRDCDLRKLCRRLDLDYDEDFFLGVNNDGGYDLLTLWDALQLDMLPTLPSEDSRGCNKRGWYARPKDAVVDLIKLDDTIHQLFILYSFPLGEEV